VFTFNVLIFWKDSFRKSNGGSKNKDEPWTWVLWCFFLYFLLQKNSEVIPSRFVKFSDPLEAENAIKTMNGKKLGNKTLLCKLSYTFPFLISTPNLYIKPLPLGMTEGKYYKKKRKRKK
jgi:RNA recognition motif. (a.k.a. RRM, RBD, or RNP domain)